MLFYTILLGLFCQVFAVLGLGNAYPGLAEVLPETADLRRRLTLRILKPKGGGGGGGGETAGEFEIDPELNSAAKEYNALGLHMGEFVWTLRLSIGDGAAIEASKFLNEADNRVFWIIWLLVTIVTSVIFLNFIVAEASASYVKVTETLEQVIW